MKKKTKIILIVIIIILILFLLFGPITFLKIGGEIKVVKVTQHSILDDNGFDKSIEYNVFLNRMTELRSLYLSWNSNQSFLFLKNMPKLENLSLFEAANWDPKRRNESVDFSTLPDMYQLNSLKFIGGNRNLTLDTTMSDKIPNVTNLEIYGYEITDFNGIGELQQLQSMYIYGGTEDMPDLTPLSKISTLERLELDTFYKTQNFSPLKNCSGLKYLSVSANKESDLVSISEISQIKHLSITNYDKNKRITINNCAYFSGLENLESLSLYGFNIQDISGIVEISTLKNIYLDKCGISYDDLKLIKNKGITVTTD